MTEALLGIAARGVGLLALGLVVAAALPRSRASARHLVLAAALVGQVALPVLGRLVPEWEAPLPVPRTAAAGLPAGNAGGTVASAPATVGGLRAGDAAPIRHAAGGPPLLLVVWAVGTGILLLRLGLAIRSARGVATRARPAGGPEWRVAIHEAAERVACARSVPVRLSHDVSLPVACGPFRPVVLLPAAAEGWPHRRRVLALGHELAHVGRRDVAIQVAARLACALFWFDPLTWLALGRLRVEAERAADDAVLRAEAGPEEYARALVAVVRAAGRRAEPSGAVGLGRGLEARVRRAVARPPRPALTRGAAGTVVAAALVAAGAVASLRSAPPPLRPETLLTGCVYAGGRHVNRWTEIDGAPTWQVLWEGPGCEVELRASPDVALVDGILVPASPGEVSARISRGGRTRTMTVVRDGSGALAFRTDGTAPADPAILGRRLRDLTREIALHTGFDAGERVPALLRAGGVPAVFREVERTQGDHAAGIYLERLLDVRVLDASETVRALELAASRVSNDAVMQDLLLRVARRADLADPALRGAFDAAFARLRSRAAREEVGAAIS